MSPASPRSLVIGVLSDTHGHLGDDVLEAFDGVVDRIVHAGDIGYREVLDRLECIAPVTAVLGNTDHSQNLPGIDWFATMVVGDVRLAVVHDPGQLRRVPGVDQAHIAIVGHTHRAAVGRAAVGRARELLVVNPGSASRPRGPEGRTVAFIQLAGDSAPTVQVARLD